LLSAFRYITDLDQLRFKAVCFKILVYSLFGSVRKTKKNYII
jgi:hypothetical protein